MPLSTEDVREALKEVKYPGFSRDIVSFGVIGEVSIEAGLVRIELTPPAGDTGLVTKISPAIERVVRGLPGAENVEIAARGAPEAPPSVKPASPGPASPLGAAGRQGPQPIEGVRNVIAVASGKGGVGKSTVATNLALALRKYGTVGLLDADVYGPSLPLLMGAEGAQPEVSEERRITPIEAHGIKTVSMGFFIEKERPVIWRGPMLSKLVTEFVRNVEWGELDFLVLDLPPGTGDVQLTLAQQLIMNGGVIVTTPQEVALADVRRGVRMFQQVDTPVIGLIENMSGYACSKCGHETDVFGTGGGEKMARDLGIPFLGRIGLVSAVGERGDDGQPIVISEPDSRVSHQFGQIASELARAA